MADQVTLRPIGNGLDDNNDGTGYQFTSPSGVGPYAWNLTDYTWAGNQRCKAARGIIRYRTGNGGVDLHVALGRPGVGNTETLYVTNQADNPTTFWGSWIHSAPGGVEWSQSIVNAMTWVVWDNDQGVSLPYITEGYVDLLIQTQPTVGITSPSWNQKLFPTQPTISWNFDAKGEGIRAHEVKIFTAAVAEGGGFDPNSSGTVWASGRVGGAANSKQVGTALSYGTAYYAYVRMAGDFNGADWWSNWASVRFIINSPSVTSAVTVTPATPITDRNTPTIGWTYSDVDGDAQEHYYVRVFPESVYSAGGFTPDTDVGTAWNSGVVTNSAARSVITGPLSPNVNYKAYVYTTDTGSGQRWSTPAVSGVFVITTAPGVVTDPPAVPEVTDITTDQAGQRLAVTLQGRGNMMTRNQASGDTGNLGLTPDANLAAAALIRDTAVTLQGGGSWKATPTVNGTTMAFRTSRDNGHGPFPVTPGRTYTALGSSRSASTGRASQLLIRWHDAAGALLSTTTGATTTNNSSSWAAHYVTGVAPASAAWAEIVMQTVTPSEAHSWENLSFAPGTSTTWTRGGLALELGAMADSFNRADSAASIGIADVGGAWNMMSGTWGIQGNRAYLVTATDGTEGQAVLTSFFLADGYVEADLALSAVRAVTGLIFRVLDSNNLMMVEVAKVGATDSIVLYKRVAGTWTALATVAGAGLILGTTIKLRVEFYGGQVLVYVDGVQRITYLMLAGELNQFGAYGKHGLRLYRHSTNGDDGATRIDNFRAGNLPTQRLTLQRSLDDGATWENVRNAVGLQPGEQQAIVYDYEVPSGVLAQYRAIAAASEAGNAVSSAYSAVLAQSVALTNTTWWLKDAVDPDLNMAIKVAPPFQFRRKEAVQTFDPMGRSTAVYVSDGAKGIEGSLNVWVRDAAEYDALAAILGNGRALLLSDPLGRAWWVKFGAQDWELIRAQPQVGETSPIRHFHSLSLPFTEVAAPAVV